MGGVYFSQEASLAGKIGFGKIKIDIAEFTMLNIKIFVEIDF